MNPYRRTQLPGIGDSVIQGFLRHADHAAAGRLVVVGNGGRTLRIGNRCVGGAAERYGERLVRLVDFVIEYRNGDGPGTGSRIDGERTAGGGVVRPGLRGSVGGGIVDGYRLVERIAEGYGEPGVFFILVYRYVVDAQTGRCRRWFVVVGNGGRTLRIGNRCVGGAAERYGERLVRLVDFVIEYRNGDGPGTGSRIDGERTAGGGVVRPGLRGSVGGGIVDGYRLVERIAEGYGEPGVFFILVYRYVVDAQTGRCRRWFVVVGNGGRTLRIGNRCVGGAAERYGERLVRLVDFVIEYRNGDGPGTGSRIDGERTAGGGVVRPGLRGSVGGGIVDGYRLVERIAEGYGEPGVFFILVYRYVVDAQTGRCRRWFVVVGNGGRTLRIGNRCVGGAAERYGERLVRLVDFVIEYRNGDGPGTGSRIDGERTAGGGVVRPGLRGSVGGGIVDGYRLVERIAEGYGEPGVFFILVYRYVVDAQTGRCRRWFVVVGNGGRTLRIGNRCVGGAAERYGERLVRLVDFVIEYRNGDGPGTGSRIDGERTAGGGVVRPGLRGSVGGGIVDGYRLVERIAEGYGEPGVFFILVYRYVVDAQTGRCRRWFVVVGNGGRTLRIGNRCVGGAAERYGERLVRLVDFVIEYRNGDGPGTGSRIDGERTAGGGVVRPGLRGSVGGGIVDGYRLVERIAEGYGEPGVFFILVYRYVVDAQTGRCRRWFVVVGNGGRTLRIGNRCVGGAAERYGERLVRLVDFVIEYRNGDGPGTGSRIDGERTAGGGVVRPGLRGSVGGGIVDGYRLVERIAEGYGEPGVFFILVYRYVVDAQTGRCRRWFVVVGNGGRTLRIGNRCVGGAAERYGERLVRLVDFVIEYRNGDGPGTGSRIDGERTAGGGVVRPGLRGSVGGGIVDGYRLVERIAEGYGEPGVFFILVYRYVVDAQTGRCRRWFVVVGNGGRTLRIGNRCVGGAAERYGERLVRLVDFVIEYRNGDGPGTGSRIDGERTAGGGVVRPGLRGSVGGGIVDGYRLVERIAEGYGEPGVFFILVYRYVVDAQTGRCRRWFVVVGNGGRTLRIGNRCVGGAAERYGERLVRLVDFVIEYRNGDGPGTGSRIDGERPRSRTPPARCRRPSCNRWKCRSGCWY